MAGRRIVTKTNQVAPQILISSRYKIIVRILYTGENLVLPPQLRKMIIIFVL